MFLSIRSTKGNFLRIPKSLDLSNAALLLSKFSNSNYLTRFELMDPILRAKIQIESKMIITKANEQEIPWINIARNMT